METTGQALLVEVVVSAVIRGAGVSQDTISPKRVNKQRILGHAILIGETGVLPVGKSLAGRTLPEADLPRAGHVQVVEVADKPLLAVIVHRDVVAGLGPDDIVAHLDIA